MKILIRQTLLMIAASMFCSTLLSHPPVASPPSTVPWAGFNFTSSSVSTASSTSGLSCSGSDIAGKHIGAKPGSAPTPPHVVCSDGVDISHHKGDVPASASTDSSDCLKTFQNGRYYASSGYPEQARDTLENFIEKCYAQSYSWGAFGDIAGAVGGISDTSNVKWLTLREWLFSVLYLNPDTMYYCEDALASTGTFLYFSGPRGFDQRGQLAVLKYLSLSGKCPYLKHYDSSESVYIWRDVHTHWLDTVKDPLATPFDSTLPTLQQIGFEILLGPQYAVQHNGVLPTSVLGEIGISPNPFVENTAINYTLNVPATLTVEVYDLLGHKVASPVPSIFTTNGDYSLNLSGSTLAPGTYYVRFSVPEGEVRTLKITKE